MQLWSAILKLWTVLSFMMLRNTLQLIYKLSQLPNWRKHKSWDPLYWTLNNKQYRSVSKNEKHLLVLNISRSFTTWLFDYNYRKDKSRTWACLLFLTLYFVLCTVYQFNIIYARSNLKKVYRFCNLLLLIILYIILLL